MCHCIADIANHRYNPQEIRMEEEIQTAGLTSRSDSLNGIYSGINNFTLEQIKGIDVRHSYGSKIDTLIRHVLWIRQNDNGAKSIIFSQFKDFLDTLAKVFSECKIGYDSIDHRNGTERFMQDPSVRSNTYALLIDMLTST
jgi:E3 ubiquitin-protein ligase SHPRH